ncbi:hypothetical protein [Gayadomonas joobiniege]|uniref:hypothetical protein n=1 Tax=Gayadomonas joobiniege TaxID=1234606 RepID=UPI000372E243|nr:hypothetical protein [Gayadomonas joobiniege]
MDLLSGVSPSVWFAMGGAFAIKLLELTELHKLPAVERPDFKDFLYWVPFFILPLLGGGLAYAYVSSDATLSPVLSINIGVSAPLILRAMAQVNPIESSVVRTPEDA